MAYWAATQLQKNCERKAERFLKQFGFAPARLGP
jgi:hypothetical protein